MLSGHCHHKQKPYFDAEDGPPLLLNRLEEDLDVPKATDHHLATDGQGMDLYLLRFVEAGLLQ